MEQIILLAIVTTFIFWKRLSFFQTESYQLHPIYQLWLVVKSSTGRASPLHASRRYLLAYLPDRLSGVLLI